MNSVERQTANAYLKKQEAIQTSAGRTAAKYLAANGDWEAHRDRVFSSLERKVVEPPEIRLTDEQLEIQSVLSNY